MRKNGIFCIEGFGFSDHRDPTSVRPILDLLRGYSEMPYVYHRCATLEELTFAINRWKFKQFHKKYPILWLAFHGEEGLIKIGNNKFTIEELENVLEDKCQGVIVYFGSCATLKWHGARIQKFLKTTRSIAAIGYQTSVDWIESASFEVQMLHCFNESKFTTDGIDATRSKVMAISKNFKKLKVRFELIKS